MTYLNPTPVPAPLPPDPAALEEIQEWAEQARQRRERTQAAKPAYLALGPALVNFDAAITCPCSCHPSPPEELHDGGASCGCQLTQEQRAARLSKVFAILADHDSKLGFDDEVAAEAARLGVQAHVQVVAAPFVICGVVDGRFFYLRSRHERYTVVMAPDDDPGMDVWSSRDCVGLVVAAGPDEDFDVDGVFSAAAALRLATNAVRVGLRRRSCVHDAAPGSWFCPACGEQLSDVLT